MTEPVTFITEEERQAVMAAYADTILALENERAKRPSRELSLAVTNLEQSRMWLFAHFRVQAGGQP